MFWDEKGIWIKKLDKKVDITDKSWKKWLLNKVMAYGKDELTIFLIRFIEIFKFLSNFAFNERKTQYKLSIAFIYLYWMQFSAYRESYL